MSDQPLSIRIEGHEVVIRLGVDALAGNADLMLHDIFEVAKGTLFQVKDADILGDAVCKSISKQRLSQLFGSAIIKALTDCPQAFTADKEAKRKFRRRTP